MKLLELAEKIVDPWDLTFVCVGYVVGFVVGTVFTPGGISAGELGGLGATGGLSAKQILWRVSARRRVRRRAMRLRPLLAQGGDHDALLTRLDREIMLLRNTVVNGEQATKYIDTLIEEFRTAKPLFATSNTSPVTQSTLPLAAAGSTSPDLNPASSGMLPLDISHSLPLQKGTTLRLARDDLQPSDQGPSPLDGAEPSSD